MNTYSFKNFLPLIIIFALIISGTFILSNITGIWDMHAVMPRFMGLFFIVFGSFKIINLKVFVEAYSMYDLLAQRSTVYAYLYPFIEVSLGIAYLMRWHLTTINSITLILMLISAAGVARELAKGEQIVCACLGVVFKIPMTYVTLAEDLLMALMALLMLYS